ncbi:MAG TPA: response regulator transcription factor, partial [Labilithrix sp.]|nr:response regulator transcription factor [Labilithrix sp.]
FTATVAAGRARAEVELSAGRFDVVVLDVMLPDGSGLDLCRAMRAADSTIPVLFLSARGAVGSRVEGLSAGGDDYLPKPFAVRELVARVRALGRRGPLSRPERTSLGEVSIDLTARRAERDGRELPLTAREWAVLELLLARAGQVITFDAMLEAIWGDSTPRARASLEVIMTRLRKKLDGDAANRVIRNVRGVGYRLDLR